MDIGAQTLAQLSLENKEAKFITIEMGSKISGYTKEYLDRLCRLNKVSYRIWNNGTLVIELESLLKETHTILLSYEGITFVDKSELTDPTPQVAVNILVPSLNDMNKTGPMIQSAPESIIENENSYGVGSAQPVPRFGGSTFGSKSLAYVGRAIVSDPEHPGESSSPHLSTPHAFIERQITMDEDLPHEEVKKGAVALPEQEIKNEAPAEITVAPDPLIETVAPTPHAIHHSVHVPIAPSSVNKPQLRTEVEVSNTVTHIPVAPYKYARNIIPERPIEEAKKAALKTEKTDKADDWDNMLFGENKNVEAKVELAEPTRPSKADVPSPYRPIKTSIDATPHHDDGMLFPPIKLSTLDNQKNDARQTPLLSQKVMVFAPEAFPGYAPAQALEDNKRESNSTLEAIAPQSEAAVTEVIVSPSPQIMPITSEIARANLFVIPMVPVKSASNAPLLPKQPLPMMRAMPQLPIEEKKNLPMKLQEHHMLAHEAHPLTKSVGFNVAMVTLVASSFVLAGGVLTGDLGSKLNTASYVAGVGQAFRAIPTIVPVNDEPLPTQTLPSVDPNTKTVNMLPFSNDVVVTDGDKPNSVVVQPVFDDGAGKAYQYDIIPEGDSASTSKIGPISK